MNRGVVFYLLFVGVFCILILGVFFIPYHSFFTKAPLLSPSSGWQVMNGGNPIDSGDGGNTILDYTQLFDVSPIVDSQGNIVYFFHLPFVYGDYGRAMGRYHASTKQWEIWTFHGWDATDQAVPKPIGGSLLNFVGQMDVYPLQGSDTQFMGVGVSNVKTGVDSMDVHPNAYPFIFNGSEFLTYSGEGGGFVNDPYMGMSPLIFQSGLYYTDPGFTLKNESSGMLVNTGYWNSGSAYIYAKPYSSANGGTWGDGLGENVLNRTLSAPSLREYFTDPRVINIKGTSDYLVTFGYAVRADYSNGPEIYRNFSALLYKGIENKWYGWTGAGWGSTNDPAIANIIPDQDLKIMSKETRQTIARDNGDVWMIYQAKSAIKVAKYTVATQQWSVETILDVPQLVQTYYTRSFVIGKDTLGHLNIVYNDNGTSFYMISEDGTGVWSTPTLLYSSTMQSALRGMTFAGNTPIVFYAQSDGIQTHLYSLSKESDSLWQGATSVVRKGIFSDLSSLNADKKITLKSLDTIGQFEAEGNYNGQGRALHTAFDSTLSLYVPRQDINSLGIFHYQTNPLTGNYWGGFWDLFPFPSGVAIDETRGKVYLSTIRYGGSFYRAGSVNVYPLSVRTSDFTSTLNPQPTSMVPGSLSMYWPDDVAVDEVHALLYVSESLKHHILVYDITSTPVLVRTIGTRGSGNGQFLLPRGMDVDGYGNLYVVDSGNNRIEKFDSAGNYINQWGSEGTGESKFIYPIDLAVDKVNDLVYVTNPLHSELQVFDTNGHFIDRWFTWTQNPLIKTNAQTFITNFTEIGSVSVKGSDLYVSIGQQIAHFSVNAYQCGKGKNYYGSSARSDLLPTSQKYSFTLSPSEINLLKTSFNLSLQGKPRIDFLEPISVLALNTSGCADERSVFLDSILFVNNTTIWINVSSMNGMNRSALIHFYGAYQNPRIMDGNQQCPADRCELLHNTGGEIQFKVKGFGNYSVIEGIGQCTSASGCIPNICATAQCLSNSCVYTPLAEKTICGNELWCQSSLCVPRPLCGNGRMDYNQTYYDSCDDGNDVNGDGCSAQCEPEEGWDCGYSGTSCSRVSCDWYLGAQWNATDVTSGQIVGLDSSAYLCNGRAINITIYNMTGSIVNTISPVIYQGTNAHTYWIAPTVTRTAQFYYSALVANDSNAIGYSGYLSVHPAGCQDIDHDTLSDYDALSCVEGIDRCVEPGTQYLSNQRPDLIPRTNFTIGSFQNTLLSNHVLFINSSALPRIQFLYNVSLIQLNKSGCFIPASVNLDNAIRVSNTSISVNSNLYFTFNVSAKLFFYGVYNNPQLYEDGVVCSNCILASRSNSSVAYMVPHFSNYSIKEGPYCGDSQCQTTRGEACSTCPTDCSSLCLPITPTGQPSTPAGGDSSSPSSGNSLGVSAQIGTTPVSTPITSSGCIENWTCGNWGNCTGNVTTRDCTDANNCGSRINLPNLTEMCSETTHAEHQDTSFVVVILIIVVVIIVGIVGYLVYFLFKKKSSTELMFQA